MSCPELLRTQAWLDGELNAQAALDAKRHVETCAECAAFSAAAAELSDALRRRASRYRAPAALRTRVAAALDKESAQCRGRPRKMGWRGFWLGAASGAGLSALAAAFAMLAILPPSAETLVQAVTAAHTEALMSRREVQVVSSDHHTVKPWFAGRVPLSPPVSDFAREGFALAGGRVDDVGRARAAVLVYRHGAHWIDLFVWVAKGARLPPETVTHGYRAAFWKRGDLDFAAVSDVDAGELHKFVHLMRSEPE